MMSEAKKKAGIQKKDPFTPYGTVTHHLENGTDLVFLQEQMGHKNLRTTKIYWSMCRTQAVHPTSNPDHADGTASGLALVSCSDSGDRRISTPISLVNNTSN